MSFVVKEHVIPAQHIRELPDALAIDESASNSTLYLHIKQYIPRNNPDPQPGDLTILAFHANGFCKETYEPIWDHLLASLPPHKRVRSIWIADMAHQGSSYLLNESKLGGGIAWEDHARDVLHMVNHFHTEMPQPILGVGHSMGAIVLIKLAVIHPRLFHSVCLLEPTLWSSINTAPIPIPQNLNPLIYRRDQFTSLTSAREAALKSPLFKTWHPRSLEIYLSHLFRPTPTLLHPSTDSTKYTLRTPKQMEVFGLYRPNVHGYNLSPDTATRLDRLVMPYMNYASSIRAPVVNPNTFNAVAHNLPVLRPRCLFLWGAQSPYIRGDRRTRDRKRNLEITGVQSGGSGGAALGCVAEDVLPGGHLFTFENPLDLGVRLARWAGEEQDVWRDERKMVGEALWKGRNTVRDRQDFEPGFVAAIKKWDGKGWDKVVKVKLAGDGVDGVNMVNELRLPHVGEVVVEAMAKEQTKIKAML